MNIVVDAAIWLAIISLVTFAAITARRDHLAHRYIDPVDKHTRRAHRAMSKIGGQS